MKRLICVIAFVLVSSHAYADCYARLTQDYSRDSFGYQLAEDAVSYDVERSTVDFARAAVIALEEQLGCDLDGVKAHMELAPANCQEVIPGVAMSRVCYVEGRYGYFFVSVDMLENINVVFNRFD
jgi:hypothetical protein